MRFIRSMAKKFLPLYFPLMLFVLLLSGCSKDASPAEVAEAFLQALKYSDTAKAQSLATPDSRKSLEWIGRLTALDSDTEKKEFEVLREELDGEYAVVYFSETGQTEEQSLTLRKGDEGWQVLARKADLPSDNKKDTEDGLDLGLDEGFGGTMDKALDELGEVFDTLGNRLDQAFEAPEAGKRSLKEIALGPEEVAERFFAALTETDLEESYKYATESTRRLIKMRWDMMDSAIPEEFEGPFEIQKSEEVSPNKVELHYLQKGEEKQLVLKKHPKRGWEVQLSKMNSGDSQKSKDTDSKDHSL